MKKISYSIFLIFSLLIAFGACSGDSYEKRVKKQKKAINRFLDEKDIVRTYPTNHIFGEDEFYKEQGSDIYYRVVKPGNLKDSLTVNDRERGNIQVTIMFDSIQFMVKSITYGGNDYPTGEPIRFTYGKASTYSSTNSNSINYSYMSQSLVLPLQKGLGPNAIVDIIVPFQSGSYYQLSNYEPFLFYRLKYTYFKPIEKSESESSTIE